MNIANNILKYYLRNCLFINGTAYAGKSTMCKMLSERYGLLLCGENFGMDKMLSMISVKAQPNLSYFHTMKDWREFVSRTPEEYLAWVEGNSRELADFEIAELISVSGERKTIVDTNIPANILREISEPDRVAIMLSPQSLSVERFFEREDEEKRFLLSQIQACDDPEAALANFLACIAAVNSKENYEAWEKSGFFTIVRHDDGRDTREENAAALAKHFGLA